MAVEYKWTNIMKCLSERQLIVLPSHLEFSSSTDETYLATEESLSLLLPKLVYSKPR
jgi:hypothetical protein